MAAAARVIFLSLGMTLFFLRRRQAAKLARRRRRSHSREHSSPLRLRLLHSPSSPPPLRRSPCHAPLRYTSLSSLFFHARRTTIVPFLPRTPEIRARRTARARPRAGDHHRPFSSASLATCSVRDLGDLLCLRTLDDVGGPELHTWRLARPCLLPVASNTTQTRATDLISFLRR